MTFSAKAFATEAVVLLVGAGWARSSHLVSSSDVLIHATYFVLPPAMVCLGMALLLFLFAAVYSTVSLKFRFAGWHFWWTTTAILGFWASFIFWEWLSQRGAAGLQGNSALLAMVLFVGSRFDRVCVDVRDQFGIRGYTTP
jgi:hypothetical protein